MRRHRPAVLSILILGPLASPAAAETPRGGYVLADPARIDLAEPNGHSSNVVFLNGCFDGGCTISPGFESSVDNRSSIIPETSTIPQFSAGQAAWDAVVQCVRQTYAPFNVQITDQDPSPQPHFEAIVAGRPEDAGFNSGVGGVAPFSCGIINNAITFSFANIYGGNIAEICWTVAQESAHAFGLDHEYLCQDPMTYLTSCGPNKAFQDENAQCGEFSPRGCMCGSTTQNSFQEILTHFGPGMATPPEVTITEPSEGDQVDPGFVVRADAVDDIEVTRTELWINNQMVASTNVPPWVFNAPTDISDGRLIVEVRAVDNYGAVGSGAVEVVQGEPCKNADMCGEGETCVDGRCVAGPGTPGGLGESCEANGDCISDLCATDSEGGRFCVEQCDLDRRGCPSGFGCRDSGDFGVCWPGFDDGGGCGCRTSDPESAPLFALLALAALLLLRRRS